MAQYVLLLRASPSGSAGFLLTGRHGGAQLEAAVRAVGGTVDALIAVTGNYDAVLIANLSEEAVLAVSHAMNVGGWYVEPHRAYLPEEVERAVALFPQLGEMRVE